MEPPQQNIAFTRSYRAKFPLVFCDECSKRVQIPTRGHPMAGRMTNQWHRSKQIETSYTPKMVRPPMVPPGRWHQVQHTQFQEPPSYEQMTVYRKGEPSENIGL